MIAGTKEKLKSIEKDFISGKCTPFGEEIQRVEKVIKAPTKKQSGTSGKAACDKRKRPRKESKKESGSII